MAQKQSRLIKKVIKECRKATMPGAKAMKIEKLASYRIAEYHKTGDKYQLVLADRSFKAAILGFEKEIQIAQGARISLQQDPLYQ